MKNFRYKIISLTLVLSILCCLCGCSDNKSSDKSTEKSEETSLSSVYDATAGNAENADETETSSSVIDESPSTTQTTTSSTTTTTTKATTKSTTKSTTKKTTTTKRKTTTTTTKKKTTTAVRNIAPPDLSQYSGVLVCDSSFVNEAARSLNAYRANAGLGSLRIDNNMVTLASVRARELSKNFSHTRPDGSNCSTVFAQYGIQKPTSVAENMIYATSFDSAADIIDEWMCSGGHKANILNGKYTRFGIALFKQTNGKEYAALILGNG